MSDDLISFYEPGGTLRPGSPSYVERRADIELRARLSQGEFCYVLTSRQMGKSSLMSRTAFELRRQGAHVVVLDLTAVGQNLTPEQWYGGLIAHMGRRLDLEDALEDFWLENEHLSPVQRFFTAIRRILLPSFPALADGSKPASRAVIFIDEIDVVRSLPFRTDEFFAAIRECYSARIEDPEYARLTFCLLGVATPAELMRDPFQTPFNIGHRVELLDFTPAEAVGLRAGLRVADALARQVLERVLDWTDGHPYLTQRLCQSLARLGEAATTESVDAECDNLFLSNRARERDDNLLYVRERLLRFEGDLTALLELYQRVLAGEEIRDDETNPLINALHLAGIVKAEKGRLRVRNRIYRHVFDQDWVRNSTPAPRKIVPGSIAVLPFASRGPGQRNEYLSDGVTEELINSLGQIPQLKVASRTSAYQFKGRSEDIRKIGDKLNVRFVLEGSVTHEVSDAFRISAELVNAVDGYCVWSDTYGEMRLQELGGALDSIVTSIVSRLRTETAVPAGTEAPQARKRSQSQAAYNHYLKGRYYWNKRHEDSVQRSIKIFEDALREDPQFALAHAALADAYIILGAYSFAAPLTVVPKASASATRALQLDNQLAQAHCALAWTLCVHDWDWQAADAAFRRAIELNPSYATARQWYAINCLTPLGRHDESLAQLWQALEVDPLSISINASVALALHMGGRFVEALAQFQQTVEMDNDFSPTYLFMGWTLEQLGRVDEARAAFEKAFTLGNENPVALASLGHLLGAAGQTAEARDILARLETIRQRRYVPCSELAFVHAGLNEIGPALDQLEQGLVEKPLRLTYLNVDPRFSVFRDEPRFQAIRRAIHLPERAQAGQAA